MSVEIVLVNAPVKLLDNNSTNSTSPINRASRNSPTNNRAT